jgi:hypothetical protein
MNEQQAATDRLVRIETNMLSLAETLKKIADDHETRLRQLEADNARLAGVLKLVAWLGAPTTAAVFLFLATKVH